MGQFDVLSLDERNNLLKAWIGPAHQHDLYVIAHVGSTIQSDAISMAQYAVEQGADAIAAVPPYYEHPSTIELLIDWLQPVLAAAPQLDFYYYHIPGSTGVTFTMHEFFTQAKASGLLPNLRYGGKANINHSFIYFLQSQIYFPRHWYIYIYIYLSVDERSGTCLRRGISGSYFM